VIEGLAAWLLFTVEFYTYQPATWPLHLAFVGYLFANLVFALRYHAGKITAGEVAADQLINLGTMIAAVACTGGVASPLVLLCIFKVGGFAFIYSPFWGMAAAAMVVLGLSGLVAGVDRGWWTMVSLEDVLKHDTEKVIELGFRLSALILILAGATWFFNRVTAQEREVVKEAQRAKDAAGREHAAATVTAALLSVSEAVSRLTRLDEILNTVVDVAPRVLKVRYCAVLLWNEERATYRGAAVSGVDAALASQLMKTRFSPAEVPDLEWVRRLGHCAVLGPRGLAGVGVPEAPALLTAPLLSGGRFYGVVVFARGEGPGGFTQRDLLIADGIARQTAVALERSRLVEESRRLMGAVESTAEAVLITDHRRRVVYANQAFLRVFGYTREEVLGRDSLSLGVVMSDERVREIERHVLESSWRGEVVVRRKDGSTFPVSLNTSLIRMEDNRIQGSVAIMEDISAQKALQEQLQRTERLAAAGELAAGVAHEVNNALVGILGQTDLAKDAQDAETLRAALARVETQGNRIAEIVQGLLGFARPQPPERRRVQLTTVVRETLALMAHDLSRARIRTEAHFAAELPPVLADTKQIQQVIVNLFTNALQAVEPRGGGSLIVTLAPDGAGAISLEVQDDGMGIDPEVLPRIFDPFFSTKEEGTGLGLSVSYGIVRAHGGDLTVRSSLGQGTTFTMRLPAAVPVRAAAGQTVLLVDDDDAVAESLGSMLERDGLTVKRVATGGEALALLAAQPEFDAIFLDVRLPDISGQEVYARLAARHPDLAARVVFVTGGLWRIDSRGSREKLPAQPTLSKPCTQAQIREVLRLLRDARAAA
jgi:PAS domain S-box-containing protein